MRFRGWAILPVVGTGASQDDAVRPDLRGEAALHDRTEHVAQDGAGRCLVAADVEDVARLGAGVLLAEHDELASSLDALAAARRNRIVNALSGLGATERAGDDLAAILRRAGRRFQGFERTFDPALHLDESDEPPTGSFVNDTFTDTAGTTLQAHTGELGATWTKHPNAGAANGLINSSGRLYNNDTDFTGQAGLYYASGIPATAEYTVAAVTFMPAGGTGVNSEAELWARLSTSALTGYMLSLERAGQGGGGSPGGMNLYRVSAGAFLSLGTYAPTLLEAGAGPMTHSLECLDATKKAFFGGVERISSTNNDVTAAGRPGAQTRNATPVSGGLQMESVTATDAGGGSTPVAGTDSATGTDDATAIALTGPTDTGTGTDGSSLDTGGATAKSGSEAFTGTDDATEVEVNAAGPDGTFTDTALLAGAASTSETGSLTESASVNTGATPVSGADSAAGGEGAASVAVALTPAQAGALTDLAGAAVSMTRAEAGGATDASSVAEFDPSTFAVHISAEDGAMTKIGAS